VTERLLSASGAAPRASDRAVRHDGSRVVLAVVSLGALLVAGLGFATGTSVLRTNGMLVFCVLGVGSALWQPVPRLDMLQRLALSVLTSLSVLTIIALTMSTTGQWHPVWAAAAVACITVPLHVAVLVAAHLDDEIGPVRRARRALDAVKSSSGDEVLWPVVAGLGGLICLVISLSHRHLDPGFYGFLADVGPWWYVGLALVVAGCVMSFGGEVAHAVPVILLVLVLTATPALVYDGPRSQSAAKHVDFVTDIRTVHSMASSVDAYNAYAGFFAAMAWLCDLCGIRDPIHLATGWPVLAGLLRVLSLRYLAEQMVQRRTLQWAAVVLAVLADSISADYFSPQSMGYVIGFLVVAAALDRRVPVSRLGVVLLGGIALAVSHQLTPFVVGGVLVVLAALRLVRPWWVPGLVLLPAGAWAAGHWWAISGFVNLSELGDASNFRPPTTAAAEGLHRLPVVEQTVIALVLGVLLLGVLAAVGLWLARRQRQAWAAAACPAVGLVAVAVNPYGQEGIFRATVFAIPWLALLAARVVTRPPHARLIMAATWVVLTITFLVSSFGLDAMNVIRVGDLAAVRAFEASGGRHPPGSHYLLLLEPGDQPTAPERKGDQHFVWGTDRLGPMPTMTSMSPRAQMEELTARFVDGTSGESGQTELFALWSPAAARYARAYALQRPGEPEALRDAFLSSGYWKAGSTPDGAFLFELDRSQYDAARR